MNPFITSSLMVLFQHVVMIYVMVICDDVYICHHNELIFTLIHKKMPSRDEKKRSRIL